MKAWANKNNNLSKYIGIQGLDQYRPQKHHSIYMYTSFYVHEKKNKKK